MKEELKEAKKELKELKEQSFAMTILNDYKRANKRQFIIILVILAMWFCTIGYLIYILNDIGTQTTTQEIDNVETIGGNVVNGDIYGENKTNKKS